MYLGTKSGTKSGIPPDADQMVRMRNGANETPLSTGTTL